MNFKEKIDFAFRAREPLFEEKDTDCFRLFNGEGDGIDALTIDRYGEFILVQYFDDEHVARVQGGAVLRSDLRHAIVAAAEKLPTDIRGVLVKNRAKIKSPGGKDFGELRRSHVAAGELPPEDYRVTQCGVKVIVDLLEGQSTGIFLDMREIRRELESFYREILPEKMLNLFSYTGLFSVHALLHGVKYAVNVDLSRGVLRRAMENYRLNNLAFDGRDFIYGDAVSWVKRFARQDKKFDFIVLDPPTFARNRKQTFSVKQDFSKIVESLGGIAPGGYVLTAINSISVGVDEFLSYHPSRWERLFLAHESSDFTVVGEPYLKVALWKQK